MRESANNKRKQKNIAWKIRDYIVFFSVINDVFLISDLQFETLNIAIFLLSAIVLLVIFGYD